MKRLCIFVTVLMLSLGLSGSEANFAMFQVSSTTLNPAVVCDVTTGIATGVGSGTCIASPATCNGTVDDSAAFTAFNTWATGTWQASHSGLVELFIPSGKTCCFLQNASGIRFAQGITNFVAVGYGATFSEFCNSIVGGGWFFANQGVNFDQMHQARLNTVSAGSTSFTLVNAADSSLYTVGQYALVAGLDLQGFGDPPNPNYYDFVQVTAINAGTGVVSFTPPLKYTYKSTWPSYGNDYFGGPATAYALHSSWGGTVEYRGLTFLNHFGVDGVGKSLTFRDVNFGSSQGNVGGVTITQNGAFLAVNVDCSGCAAEVDKIVTSATMQNSSWRRISFQSPTPDTLNLSGVTIVDNLNGTPRKVVGSNVTITNDLTIGVQGQGYSNSFSCATCSFGSIPTGAVIDVGGNPAQGVQNTYSMSGGVITIPPNLSVTGTSSGSGGVVRITVSSTTGYTTGKFTQTNNIHDVPNGTYQLTVVDGTHIDLTGTTFVSGAAGGGIGLLPVRWAVPGANLMWSGQFNYESKAFQVVDLTQDATGVHVSTTLGGGFPTVPLSAGVLGIRVHPAPTFTCSNCSGSVDATVLSSAGAQGVPLWSYYFRQYTGAVTADVARVWGALVTTKFNVTAAFGGAGTPNFNLGGPLVTDSGNTTSTWNPTINPKQSGLRTVTPTTVTGSQTGDSLSAPGASTFLLDNQIVPTFNTDLTGQTTLTLEIVTDQGVVPP